MFRTPILFLVFNRPDTTAKVFSVIREAKPRCLFIAADGPRTQKAGEKENCQKVREIVMSIDWECEVKTLFRNENLGCGKAVSSAINWFFEHVEEGIILEDDCLPDQSFFYFCETLLDFYRDQEQIMHISGNNFQFGKNNGKYSYYFSQYNHIWGWATWKRAWSKYDFELTEFKSEKYINRVNFPKQSRQYWLENFRRTANGEIDTWDYQWTFAIWYHNGFAILPNVNLVTNIGFGQEATHTTQEDSVFGNIAFQPLTFPIIHPRRVNLFKAADFYSTKMVYGINPKNQSAFGIGKYLPKALRNMIRRMFQIIMGILKYIVIRRT